MKKLFLILVLLFIAQSAFALNIVYPKKNEVTINAQSTFFIGSADKKHKLTINGQAVEVHSSGGFAQTVPLAIGINTFKIKSGKDTQTYTITRPKPSVTQSSSATQLKELCCMQQ